ncbi:hypothetical protein EAH87_00480 [Sphingomonas koreensis]|nr:hypothetical protein EAH87_00480 [Sphingomonas koreensis]
MHGAGRSPSRRTRPTSPYGCCRLQHRTAETNRRFGRCAKPIPSSPRRRGPIICRSRWVPAFAGMTRGRLPLREPSHSERLPRNCKAKPVRRRTPISPCRKSRSSAGIRRRFRSHGTPRAIPSAAR